MAKKEEIKNTESCRFCYASSSVAGYKVLVAVDGGNLVLYHNGWSRPAHVQSYRDIEGDRFRINIYQGLKEINKLVPAAATNKVLIAAGDELVLGDPTTASLKSQLFVGLPACA